MIEFKSINKTIGSNQILKNINLNIECGELFALIGQSGSGKTTLMKMINGLINPDSGQIIINGKNQSEYNQRELRHNIGYIFQQIALFPNLTIQENISLIPEIKGWKKSQTNEKIKILLKQMELEENILKRKPSELSGGQNQRAAIIRAIITNPQIILMDEPFSALDPLSRAQLQKLIKQLHQTIKTTILLVTHDINEAAMLGERIAIMKKGEILQVDTPQNIIQNPANKYIKQFFEQANQISENVGQL